MRRAVYHHTFRLGTLAFRALGPSEAVGVFTRQIESLHDGLYVWLTVAFAEPVKFGLLLALALLMNFWLSLAFLMFALLVWLIGGQVAVYFRRQERDATQGSADQLALLQESLMMMRLVKCYLMELFNQARVERQLMQYTHSQLHRYRGEAIYRPLLVFLGTLAAVVLLYVAGLIVLDGRLGVAGAIVAGHGARQPLLAAGSLAGEPAPAARARGRPRRLPVPRSARRGRAGGRRRVPAADGASRSSSQASAFSEPGTGASCCRT